MKYEFVFFFGRQVNVGDNKQRKFNIMVIDMRSLK